MSLFDHFKSALKAKNFVFYLLVWVVAAYGVQLILPVVFEPAGYGKLKKVMVLVSYFSLFSLGSKDEYHLHNASGGSTPLETGVGFYGLVGFFLSMGAFMMWSMLTDSLSFPFVAAMFFFYSTTLLFQYSEIYIGFNISKTDAARTKGLKEIVLLLGLLVVTGYAVGWVWFLAIQGLAVVTAMYITQTKTNFFKSFGQSLRFNSMRFPWRGMRMQVINLINQFSINGDKLLATSVLINVSFAKYSILFLLPQAVLLLVAQIGNYNLDVRHSPGSPRRWWNLALSLLFGLVTLFACPVVGLVYDQSFSGNVVILVAIGVCCNSYWMLVGQNELRRENAPFEIVIFAGGLLFVVGLLYVLSGLAEFSDFVLLYCILGVYKNIFYYLWLQMRRKWR